SNGTVWAWGYGSAGMLGNGASTNSKTAVQMVGLSNVVAITAGTALNLSLKSDGTVWACGSALGNGRTTNGTTPVAVHGLSNVVAIAAGSAFGMAVKQD